MRIYTDGATQKLNGRYANPGKGGWSCILLDDDIQEVSGSMPIETTNNRMELLAVVVGLNTAPAGSNVTVCTDSEYVIRVWNRALRGRVWNKNDDFRVPLLEAIGRHRATSIEWVRGHNGDVWNERADVLAQSEAGREYEV